MKVTIDINIDGQKIKTLSAMMGDDITHNSQPSVFRKQNSTILNQLSRVLEDVGFNIISHMHKGMDKFTYYAFFHPMTSNRAIRHINKVATKRKAKKKK